jgi:hypothetical protein
MSSSIMVAAPPLGTRPSLFISKGFEAFSGADSSFEKAPNASKLPTEK